MSRKFLAISAVILAGIGLLPESLRAELRVGTSVVDITPDQWPLAPRGSFFPKPVEGAHDPLHVRCVVLANGDTTIALAVVDSCMVHREQLGPAKAAASEKTGIPVDHLMVSSTHTHSAPFANASNGTPQEIAYQEKLINGITEAIVQAHAKLQLARLGWSGYDLPDEVHNRRWFLQPDKMPLNPFGEVDIVKMNPPASPDVLISPAGPVDPEVSVLYVEDAKGKPLTVFANYALHYVGNTGSQMSADYFGEFARLMPFRLRNVSDDFVAILSNGTSGDINNIDRVNLIPPREPYEQIRIVAGKTADAAYHAIRQIDREISDPVLDMRQREITLKHRIPSAEQIERAKNIIKVDEEGEKKLPKLAKVYAQRTLSLAENPETTKVLVQAIRIGDLAICTMPFEVLVEIGLDLKKRSPAADTFIVELANGGYGYLPPPNQHKFGGYETWLGTNKVQEDTSVILSDNLLEMLGELFPQ
ncbi:MAG: neutral/alkaline non-lysosomal ceramidase N-terminal domain-containing protein [Verrucomicrobiae bacterium]|nr:neutral/alkaline non-lysosomal ceramidase N-terminal domain-containing protein [Verrucomicrobiae bacterium]